LAVTVIVAEPIFVVDAAVSVRVLAPVSEANVTGLLLHFAVTPAGNPLTVRLVGPLYVPFPASVTTSDIAAPCATTSALDAAVTVNAGGVKVTVIGKVLVAV